MVDVDAKSSERSTDEPAEGIDAAVALRRVGLVVGALVLVTLAELLRQRGHHPWDVIASDDGPGFLVPEWSRSPVSLIWTSYQGYLNVPLRLLAIPLAVLPRSWGSAYLAVTAAVFTALLGWFVALASRGLVRQPALRWLLGFVLVFTPAMGFETNAMFSEQHFPLVFAAFWAVISTERSRTMVILRAAVVFLACTSSPLALAYVPIAIFVVVYRRARADMIVGGALGTGALLQGITLLVATGPGPLARRTLDGFPSIYGQRILSSWLVGDSSLRSAWLDHGSKIILASVFATVVTVAVLGACVRRSQWIWAAIALIWSGAIFAAELYARGVTLLLQTHDGFFTYDGGRYVLIPFWLFFSALVLLAGGPEHPAPRPVARLAQIGRVLLVVQAVALVVVGFRVTNYRSPGPSYAVQLRAAEKACKAHPHARPVLKFSPPGWFAAVHCEDL